MCILQYTGKTKQSREEADRRRGDDDLPSMEPIVEWSVETWGKSGERGQGKEGDEDSS